ncbi:MAG: diguanylate cyclase response regulator [Betaproteobacteria bacterium]|nr:diguanylate cyclase response regulator [Betaproteobacteria bacterium]MEA3157579.1 hypothetical protein [Betaproteobacteria bacterium]
MKVLIAEDDGPTRLKLEGVLSKLGYEVSVAQDGRQAWQLLQHEDGPLLVILDWMMPGMDGVEVCRNVRQSARGSSIYIVMLTLRGQQHDVVAAMEAGADDYLSKPFNADELRVRLNSGERVLKLQERLRAQASHDALTGILNRRAVLDLLRRELGHVARDEASVGVILADLDEFKHVNDTHGHAVGDAVLLEAARRLGVPLRRVDALGRYGGEEFIIVLPRCDMASALHVAERVRCAVAAEPVCTSAGHVDITVSLGVGVANKGQATSLEALLLAADQALYRAKSLGRNRVEGS